MEKEEEVMYFKIYREVKGLFPLRKIVLELYDDDGELIERNICFRWFIKRKQRRMLKRSIRILEHW